MFGGGGDGDLAAEIGQFRLHAQVLGEPAQILREHVALLGPEPRARYHAADAERGRARRQREAYRRALAAEPLVLRAPRRADDAMAALAVQPPLPAEQNPFPLFDDLEEPEGDGERRQVKPKPLVVEDPLERLREIGEGAVHPRRRAEIERPANERPLKRRRTVEKKAVHFQDQSGEWNVHLEGQRGEKGVDFEAQPFAPMEEAEPDPELVKALELSRFEEQERVRLKREAEEREKREVDAAIALSMRRTEK
eukprot:gb/GEZN01012182.1/.p1 GENE.gb/GEZN01012182.1/~~gb/GEZN01012182.1/.p1  ORF type:complete len:252 (+),score=26.95 gb/GEZN01012182.1/:277-1032(+)